jgi:hypothetical protein
MPCPGILHIISKRFRVQLIKRNQSGASDMTGALFSRRTHVDEVDFFTLIPDFVQPLR